MHLLKSSGVFGLSFIAALAARAEPPQSADISFEHPILQEARVSAPFGMRTDPFTKRPGWHGGIDLGAQWDAEIFAPAKGEVVFAGRRSGYGNMVDLKLSDDWVLRFAHMKTVRVEQGDVMEAGSVLGHVGSVAQSTGPHLHLEARSDGKQYNPKNIEALQFYAAEKQASD